MAYYEVSILITILTTSLIAFYLLYKANDLNLGILISISTGSIILGLTFGPAFKKMLDLIMGITNINKNIVLALSILAVLTAFLIFILIISIVISMCIPERIVSVNCGLLINKFGTGLKNKIMINSLKTRMSEFSNDMTEYGKKLINIYNKFKLKKSVDTKEIIDKMGIEKNAGIETGGGNSEIDNATYSDTFIDEKQTDIADSEPEMETEISETVAKEASEYIREDIAPEPEQIEIAAYDGLVMDEAAASDEFTIDLAAEEGLGIGSMNEQKETEDDEPTGNTFINSESYDAFDDDLEEEIGYVSVESTFILKKQEEELGDADSLVLKAFSCKGEGKKQEAIEYYFKALEHRPDKQMIFWIVLDICTLYKQLNLNKLAVSILESLVSRYGDVIEPDIKEEILNNLIQN